MFNQNESRSLSRRSVIASAAWAVPVIAVAVAAPLAAASAAAAPIELSLPVSSTVTLPPANVFPGFAYVTARNVSSVPLTSLTLSVSGMSAGGFVVGLAGAGAWQLVSGDSSTLVVVWTGSAAPGESTSTLTLTVQYPGSTPPPVTGTLTVSAVGRPGVAPAVITAVTT
ncbi:MAG: hypothetical protein P0Y60_16740 [Candidatus Microbacterium colombiense]|nr:MAG: hypothetical protein P0Y60_16740 [Microbacterium sp.]